MRFLRRFIISPCPRNKAGEISFDALIPVIALPSFTLVASLSLTWTIFVFIVTPLLIYYLNRNFLRFLMHAKFFYSWTIVSVLMLMLIFELSVVPLLEILPEENFVFIVCVVSGLACAYQTRVHANRAIQEIAQLQGLEHGEGNGELCTICRKRALPKATHCRLCQTCILGREYHCRWLDCCIGMRNFRWYLACLFFSAIAFVYGSNLTMTTVCHPFLFAGMFLLPDDCNDVYCQYEVSISFVSAVYSLLIGVIIFLYFINHLWSIYLGESNEKHLLKNDNQHNKEALKSLI